MDVWLSGNADYLRFFSDFLIAFTASMVTESTMAAWPARKSRKDAARGNNAVIEKTKESLYFTKLKISRIWKPSVINAVRFAILAWSIGIFTLANEQMWPSDAMISIIR